VTIAEAIRCPVRLLQADPTAGGALADDECEAFRAAVCECTVERFPGLGHQIHQAEPEWVCAAVASLAEVQSGLTEGVSRAFKR
jgi:pimeloyl-ACP methyl ester carboxylesterase